MSTVTIDFWATLESPVPEDRAAGIGPHRSAVTRSPIFQSERELSEWIRDHIRGGDEVQAWKRESRDGHFHESSITAREDLPPNPERLARILAYTRKTLDAGRVSTKATGREVRTAMQRGEDARERLAQAGAALKEQEAAE